MNEYNESDGINAVKIVVKTGYPWNRPTAFHLAAMEMAMEKENVPEIRELIRNSPWWACTYLAGWYARAAHAVPEIDLFIMGQQARRIEPFDRSPGRVQREFLSLNTKILDLMHVPMYHVLDD